MKSVNWRLIDKNIRLFLGIKRPLLAIRVLREKTSPSDRKLMFCEALTHVERTGETVIHTSLNEKCPSAEICLGFYEPADTNVETRIKPANVKALEISLLSATKSTPDIVLMTLDPGRLMELSLIANRIGEKLEFMNKGEFACGEYIAMPYMTGRPTVSFLCSGMRDFAGFSNSELMIGMPTDFLVRVYENISELSKRSTSLCGCRVSDLPKSIIDIFRKLGFEKSTDFFFGKVNSVETRIFLNKDAEGRISTVTIGVVREHQIGDIENYLQKLPPNFNIVKRGSKVFLSSTHDIAKFGLGKLPLSALKDVIGKKVKELVSLLN